MRTLRAIALVVFVGLYSAYVDLGDLITPTNDQSGFEWVYLSIAVTGLVVLVAWAGWHALWLFPIGTLGFACVYESWFWDPPPEAIGGMDSIGWYPSGVMFVVPFVLMLIVPLALLRGRVISR